MKISSVDTGWFLLQQRTHYLAELGKMYGAEMKEVYDAIKRHLPKDVKTILDVGAGLAGIDVMLNRHYKAFRGYDPQIILCDKDGVSRRINAGFHQDAESFAHYNDFHDVTNFMVENGVPANSIQHFDVRTHPNFECIPDGSVDLVISLLSMGFHYPIKTYEKQLKRIMAPGAVLICDVRKGQDALLEILRITGHATIIGETSDKAYRMMGIKKDPA